MSDRRTDLAAWFEPDNPGRRPQRASSTGGAIEDQDTVIPQRLTRHVPPSPPAWFNAPSSEAGGVPALRFSSHTTFYNGHDGGGAALLRVMTDSYQAATGESTSTAVVELPLAGIQAPIDTSVRVLCVRADAMGAKVAMRTVVSESRLVVVAAQIDGIFHPRVPHAARFAFRHLATLCPVHFMPYETKWRSDLTARPGRRYRQATAQLVNVIETTRSDAAIHQPLEGLA